MKIKFEKASGVLPIGVTVNEDGRLNGRILFENIDLNPEWTTPSGVLATVDEGETITLGPVFAMAKEGLNLESYSVLTKSTKKYCLLPWGLTLNPHTGVISGTVIDIGGNEKTWYDGEEPQWITESGLLGTLDEKEENIVLNVSSYSPLDKEIKYIIKSGYLPWGLTLDSNSGAITGDVKELIKRDIANINDMYEPPVWNTPKGVLGVFNEDDIVSLNVSATSRNSSPVVYRVIKGFLPRGVLLSSKSGDITGTCLELRESGLIFFDLKDGPVISNTINVNGSDINAKDGDTILTTSIGQVVNIAFTATPKEGRSFRSFYLYSKTHSENYNTLPFGLILNPINGVISGTVSPTTASGIYEIVLAAMDNTNQRSTRTFKIIVE